MTHPLSSQGPIPQPPLTLDSAKVVIEQQRQEIAVLKDKLRGCQVVRDELARQLNRVEALVSVSKVGVS